MNYLVYYDILKSGSGLDGGFLGFILGALVGIFFLFRSLRRRKTFEIIFSIIWLTGFTGLGLLGFGNVYYQHNQCQHWAKSGDYQIVEGSVTKFVEYNRTVYEQFSVKDIHFEYSPYDLSVCGFRQTIAEGSPIRDGLQVRVTYKDGRILKLEIADNQ